jgi:hypothetical protein
MITLTVITLSGLHSIIKTYIGQPVLTTNSEQRPQPDPQTSQINTSFIGGTSEITATSIQQLLFGAPKGGHCAQV